MRWNVVTAMHASFQNGRGFLGIAFVTDQAYANLLHSKENRQHIHSYSPIGFIPGVIRNKDRMSSNGFDRAYATRIGNIHSVRPGKRDRQSWKVGDIGQHRWDRAPVAEMYVANSGCAKVCV